MSNKIRIVIEFNEQGISVSHPHDTILTIGLMELAKFNVLSKLKETETQESPMIIVPKNPIPKA